MDSLRASLVHELGSMHLQLIESRVEVSNLRKTVEFCSVENTQLKAELAEAQGTDTPPADEPDTPS